MTIRRGSLMTKPSAAPPSTCSGSGCHLISNDFVAMAERIDHNLSQVD